MKKTVWRRRAQWFGMMGLLGLISAAALAASDYKLQPRLVDVVSTGVSNWAMNRVQSAASREMADPSIDDGPVFSYFARPSFQIGVRGEPMATQVIDGHLWTGAAEWMLLVGDPLMPHNQRIYTLLKGYLPCIEYSVERDGVTYTVRAFQYWLDGPGTAPVNFVRVEAANKGGSMARAKFGGGFSYGTRDHRSQSLQQMEFNRLWRYEMTDHEARRDGKIIHAFAEKPDRLESRPGREYERPFSVAGREDPAGIAAYERELKPGEKFTADFVMPHYPAGAELGSKLAAASFDERLSSMSEYWEGWLGKGAHFEVSERKVMDATRSYVIHALMSQNVVSEDEVEQHVNRLQYNRFWLRDSSFFVSMYDKWGYPEVAKALLRHFFGYQRADGNFLSQPGQLDGWGQSLWALGEHARYTEDYNFAVEALPYVKRAVAWFKDATGKDPWGVMPPANAMDNETIMGRYTGHNFWALHGLDGAIDLAYLAQDEDAAIEFQELHRSFRERFLTRLRQVAAEQGGVIPPGLDVTGGTSWGNLLPLYPTVQMDPQDPLVTATFADYRANHMEEGIATWHQSLHHYVTERVAQTALVRGESELALDDFYAMLLHTGSCHEGFEWAIFPWAGRDYCMDVGVYKICNYTPHGWYAADMNILFRNLLVREQGRALHLASALSPAWTGPGMRVAVTGAPTPFAKVTYSLEFDETGATFVWGEPGWCACCLPEKVVLHVPYNFELRAVEVNGEKEQISADELEVWPARCKFENYSECRIRLTMERREVEPKSYEHSVQWYKAEYKRRWAAGRNL